MKRAILCAALCASGLFAAGAASSEDGQMRVRVSDLNLTTSAGAQTALTRIRWSAGVFCEHGAGRQSIARGMEAERCVSAMTQKSVAQLNAPMVTALLNGEAGQPTPSAPIALAQK